MKHTVTLLSVLLLASLAVLHAAEASPPAKPTPETRAKIEAQRKRITALPVPANLQRRTIMVGAVEREFYIHIPNLCKRKASPVVFALGEGAGPKTRDISAPEEFSTFFQSAAQPASAQPTTKP